jgi:hypothetical protein
MRELPGRQSLCEVGDDALNERYISERADLLRPYEDSMIIRSGWYFSATGIREEWTQVTVRILGGWDLLPRISSNAVFI